MIDKLRDLAARRPTSLRMDQLSVGGKIALAPAVGLVLLVLIAMLGYAGLERSRTVVDRVVANDVAALNSVASANTSFSNAEAALYRLTTRVANEEAVDVDAEVQQILAQLENAQDVLRVADGGNQQVLDQDVVGSAVTKIEEYAEAVEVLGSMLALDFESASFMLPPFEENAQSVRALFQSITQQANEAAATKRNSINGEILAFQIAFAIVMALAIGLVSVVTVYTTRHLRDAIAGLVTATEAVAKGDTSYDLAPVHRSDELENIVVALEVFKSERERAQQLENKTKDLEREQLEADTQFREQRISELADLAERYDAEVSTIINAVTGSTDSVASLAEDLKSIAETSVNRSSAMTNDAGNISRDMDAVASATEELSLSNQEIEQSMEDSSQAVRGMVSTMEQTSSAVLELGSSAEEIGEVSSLIAGIAAQTNLLALNASIEAARAGESGRGFAVVAGEVKALAQQTAKATDDITEQVRDVQKASAMATEALQTIAEMVEKVNLTTTTVSSAITQQSSATSHISDTVFQSAERITKLSEDAVGVDHASDENGKAAAELARAASFLKTEIGKLSDQSSDFVKKIRAA